MTSGATRSEKIDTRALLNGEAGDANFTAASVRMKERARVLDYWPDEIIVPVRDGFLEPPPWRLFLDPTSWHDVQPSVVHDYVRGYLASGRWPSLDGLRRRFDRVSNHRGPGEVEAQTSLL